jgi:V/A-type H+-transporting ATPase subunit E
MQGKLQELTEKIYQDGVEKARSEAERVLAEARSKAEGIVKQAEDAAAAIREAAVRQAEEQKRNVASEIGLAARQAESDLKQRIAAMVAAKVLEGVGSSFDDAKFVGELIEQVVRQWSPQGGERVELALVLPGDRQAAVADYLGKRWQALLAAGLEVRTTRMQGQGFRIGPKDGSFAVSFTDEAFAEFFQAYLRPRAARFLYGEG